MKTQRWNWLDEGLLPVLLTLMRTAWLWPWLALGAFAVLLGEWWLYLRRPGGIPA